MMNCRQVTRLVSQSMDAKLPWYRSLAVRFHFIVNGQPARQDRACQARQAFSSSIGLRNTPIPSISISQVSPAFIHTGSGLRA